MIEETDLPVEWQVDSETGEDVWVPQQEPIVPVECPGEPE